MENNLVSNIKRGLKITYNYIISFFIFLTLATPFISLTTVNTAKYLRIVSFVVFVLLFIMIYVETRNYGMKEKRPQYNINPKPYKGLLYGFIGVIPLLIVQTIIIGFAFPQGPEVLHRRTYQAFSGPFYWLACLLGNKIIHYIVLFLVLIVISFLGYFAGHRDFYIIETIRNILGIKPKRRNHN